MSYIVRDHIIVGLTAVDGNNPHSIQGFEIPAEYQSEHGQVKDYLDLTDHLGVNPFELAWDRNANPLLGGIHTVQRHGGVEDFLAHYYTDTKWAEQADFVQPENRQHEIPDITFGRGGTIDVMLTVGSLWIREDDESLDAFTGRIANTIKLYYNYGDMSNTAAPLPVNLTADSNPILDRGSYKVVIPKFPHGGVGRCVGYVKLEDSGITKLNEHVAEASKAEHVSKGIYIEKPLRYVAFFELCLLDKIPEITDYKMLGAVHKKTTVNNTETHYFDLIHPHIVHESMDFPIERVRALVPINLAAHTYRTDIPLVYTLVPYSDYTSKGYSPGAAAVAPRNIWCWKFTHTINGNTTRTIFITALGAEFWKHENHPLTWIRSWPSTPCACSRLCDVSWYLPIDSDPLDSVDVISPIRTEGWTAEGYHMVVRSYLGVTLASDFEWYPNAWTKAVVSPVEGKEQPIESVSCNTILRFRPKDIDDHPDDGKVRKDDVVPVPVSPPVPELKRRSEKITKKVVPNE